MHTPLARLSLGLIAALCLAGCVPDPAALKRAEANSGLKECPSGTAGACFFVNSPVRLGGEVVRLPGRPYAFHETTQDLRFVDGAGRAWQAPGKTLTDGASIPPLFVPLVGDPRTPEFLNAAAMHDAYCGIGNEKGPNYHRGTWQEVHRMFHDTLVVSGTNPVKAKVMFAAVWLGGPRWNPVTGNPDLSRALAPDAIKMAAMVQTKAFIERENPGMADLIDYLEWQDRQIDRRANAIGDADRMFEEDTTSGFGGPSEGGDPVVILP